jgi:hypothetical protein
MAKHLAPSDASLSAEARMLNQFSSNGRLVRPCSKAHLTIFVCLNIATDCNGQEPLFECSGDCLSWRDNIWTSLFISDCIDHDSQPHISIQCENQPLGFGTCSLRLQLHMEPGHVHYNRCECDHHPPSPASNVEQHPRYEIWKGTMVSRPETSASRARSTNSSATIYSKIRVDERCDFLKRRCCLHLLGWRRWYLRLLGLLKCLHIPRLSKIFIRL